MSSKEELSSDGKFANVTGFSLKGFGAQSYDTVQKHVQGFALSTNNKYQNYVDRIATFTAWAKSMPITAKELSHAGFVYTGFPDKVHCPWCKLTLYNFDRQDSAFEEHVKHSKGCLYLQMTVPEILEVNRLCPQKRMGLLKKLDIQHMHTHTPTRVEKGKLIP